jgi:hypothetical protein
MMKEMNEDLVEPSGFCLSGQLRIPGDWAKAFG